MTAREKLKAFIEKKRKEEREENKNNIERQIDDEIDYKEMVQSLSNMYKANFAY